MKPRQFSLSAVSSAASRAIHQDIDGGAVFTDPFARPILNSAELRDAEKTAARPENRVMRFFIAARSRYTEDAIAVAVSRGLRQIVVLGAGLDTFCLRNPFADQGVTLFEVDHPETQASKRERLARIRADGAPSIAFVPVDFETQDLGSELQAAGHRADAPTFFMWLGVVPYLSRDAIFTTLGHIAELSGSEVIFDYSEPLENYEPARRARMIAFGERLAELGEPWLSHFDPDEIAAELARLGFVSTENRSLLDLAALYRTGPDAIIHPGAGPHVMHART